MTVQELIDVLMRLTPEQRALPIAIYEEDRGEVDIDQITEEPEWHRNPPIDAAWITNHFPRRIVLNSLSDTVDLLPALREGGVIERKGMDLEAAKESLRASVAAQIEAGGYGFPGV